MCRGLGHASCQGGGLPLNPFGAAFMTTGFQWTAELCAADSDGDGKTNGEELGDPCCKWRAGDEPSLYMAGFQPSHPGFSSHTQPQDYAAPACDSAETSPSARGPPMSSFNEGEVRHVIEFKIKSFELPKRRTTYVNIPVRRPPVWPSIRSADSLLRDMHRTPHHLAPEPTQCQPAAYPLPPAR